MDPRKYVSGFVIRIIEYVFGVVLGCSGSKFCFGKRPKTSHMILGNPPVFDYSVVVISCPSLPDFRGVFTDSYFTTIILPTDGFF